MALFPSPSPFGDAERQRLVDTLNQVTIDGIALYLAAQVAHWNVRGPAFGPLHKLFGKLRGMFDGLTDATAERVAQLGGLAAGTAEQLVGSKVKAYPADTTDGMAHVRELESRVADYAASLHEAMMVADEIGDQVTFQILNDAGQDVEKFGWMLVAHLQSKMNAGPA